MVVTTIQFDFFPFIFYFKIQYLWDVYNLISWSESNRIVWRLYSFDLLISLFSISCNTIFPMLLLLRHFYFNKWNLYVLRGNLDNFWWNLHLSIYDVIFRISCHESVTVADSSVTNFLLTDRIAIKKMLACIIIISLNSCFFYVELSCMRLIRNENLIS